jgi:hypothetical protein
LCLQGVVFVTAWSQASQWDLDSGLVGWEDSGKGRTTKWLAIERGLSEVEPISVMSLGGGSGVGVTNFIF